MQWLCNCIIEYMAHEKILIVDDDTNNVHLWKKILELAGFLVFPFNSSEKALEYLNDNVMDLVLADIRMPIIDGFELLQRARKKQPLLPFVFMTAYGTLDTAIEALQKEANGLILKPFPPYKQLVRSIRDVIDQSYQKQEISQAQVLQPILAASIEFPDSQNLHTLYQALLDRTVQSLAADSAALLSYSPITDEFVTLGSRGKIDFNALGSFARPQLQNHNQKPTIISLSRKRTPTANLKSAILTTIIQGDDVLLFWVEKSTQTEPFKQKDTDIFMIVVRQWILALENAKLSSKVKDLMAEENLGQKGFSQSQVSETASQNEIYLGMPQSNQGEKVIFNFVQRCVEFRNQRIRLTHNEAQLLKVMQAECASVIPHEKLVYEIHKYQPEKNEAAIILRPLISRLKKKLAIIEGNPIRIKNVRGDGYMLEIGLD
jgi:DNA-binding response OmpR family regulator